MNFQCQKTENCFTDAQTYEYNLPITAEAFTQLLDESWQLRCNQKLRRPVFLAEGHSLRIKGILAGTIIRVSFPTVDWELHKTNFENFLKNL